MKLFKNYEEYGSWSDTHEYRDSAVYAVETEGYISECLNGKMYRVGKVKKISADGMFYCKSWKTAIRRFMKELTYLPESHRELAREMQGWCEGMLESCENGYFKEEERVWCPEELRSVYTGGYHWAVENQGEGAWYVELTIVNEY